MAKLKGIYIEDDVNNIEVIKLLFEFEDIIIVSLDELPDKVEDIYPLVMRNEPDFLIIDHELNKKVGYTGIEALREIRRHDRTIYAALLTNFPLEDFKEEFGEYDNEISKRELNSGKKMKEIVSKISRACELRKDNQLLEMIEMRSEIEDDKLKELRQIKKRLLKE